jgi:hypothetical protein
MVRIPPLAQLLILVLSWGLTASCAQAQIVASDLLDKPLTTSKSPVPSFVPPTSSSKDLLGSPLEKDLQAKTQQVKDLEQAARQQAIKARQAQLEARNAAQLRTAKGVWQLNKGSLKNNLSSWLNKVGYSLEWKLPHDFSITHPARIEKSLFGYDGALSIIESAYKDSHNAFRLEVYHGNKVVLVTPKAKSLPVPR